MDGIFPQCFTELFRLIRSLPSQSPDKSGVMGKLCRIIRHLGSGIVSRGTLTLASAAPTRSLSRVALKRVRGRKMHPLAPLMTTIFSQRQKSTGLRYIIRKRSDEVSQSAVTLHHVTAFCFTRYGSLKSPLCSCVSITLRRDPVKPAESFNALLSRVA